MKKHKPKKMGTAGKGGSKNLKTEISEIKRTSGSKPSTRAGGRARRPFPKVRGGK